MFSMFLNQPELVKSASFCVSGQLFQVGRGCVSCFRCCASGVFRVSAFGGGCIFCVSGVKSARIGQNPLVSVFQLFQVGRGCVSCFRFCVGAVFRVSGFRGKLCFVFRVLQAETLSGVDLQDGSGSKQLGSGRLGSGRWGSRRWGSGP